MLKHLSPLSILAIAALATGAFAQDSTPDEQPATPEAAAEAPETPGADEQLDLGQPVADGEPQPGDRYSKQTFGDWELACIKTDTETDPCSLLQILEDDKGTAVAEISMFRIKGSGKAVAGASVVVPLETLLPAQLTIAVDQGAGKRYNYSFCTELGCVAQIGLTQEDIDAFKRGKVAKVSLRPAPAPDRIVELNMSLNGFTTGFDAVDVVEQ